MSRSTRFAHLAAAALVAAALAFAMSVLLLEDELPRLRRRRTDGVHRTGTPRVAARDKWKQIEALGRLVEFLRSYRSAWAARRAGRLDAIFPRGTYLLRVVHGVPCAGVG